jgi:soluble lytic murein transglycosylase-like protein
VREHVEWIDNQVNHYVKTYPSKNDLIAAIKSYTKSQKKSNEYSDLILIHSYYNGMNPWLLASMIAKESSFNSRAKSYVGAMGLMQVMPNWHENESGIFWGKPDYNRKDLYDPNTNIRIGVAILKHYIEKYGDYTKALSAYNGTKGSMKYPTAVFTIFNSDKYPTMDLAFNK